MKMYCLRCWSSDSRSLHNPGSSLFWHFDITPREHGPVEIMGFTLSSEEEGARTVSVYPLAWVSRALFRASISAGVKHNVNIYWFTCISCDFSDIWISQVLWDNSRNRAMCCLITCFTRLLSRAHQGKRCRTKRWGWISAFRPLCLLPLHSHPRECVKNEGIGST